SLDGKGEPVYYVAKTALPDLLQIAPKNWRDPKLLRLPADLVSGITLTQPGGQIALARQSPDAPWYFTKPLSTRGSKDRIGDLLSTVLNLEIKEAIEALNGNGANSAISTGSEMAASEMKISVTLRGHEGQPLEMTLKKPPKDVTETKATVANRKAVFTVLSQSLNVLWAQPNDLRDRMLARINEDEVIELEIVSAAYSPVKLRKESGSWFLERNGKLHPANGDRIGRFFEALNTQPILEFTADSASNLALYGLDAPILTASWKGGDSKPSKLLIGKSADNRQFFAKYEDEPSVYRVDAALLPSILPDNMKWKGLGVMRFSQFALRRISLSAGTAPPVILNYDPSTAQWTGSIAGGDITPMIDRVKADKLAGTLAKFNAQDWVTDPSEAIHALQKPELRAVVTLGEPGTNTGPTRDIVLNFAPTQPGAATAFYFGQVEGDPDLFYISRGALQELLQSVFKEG
ncbi:MAG TPA: DUF4340 domain-containing protein, partial [Prosthecobacter sp.]|nr:DUF4340 domain-containing protein [Prosthecobacter sp.]